MNSLQLGNLYYMEYGACGFVLFVTAHACPLEDQRDDDSYMSFILYDHAESFYAEGECRYVNLPSYIRKNLLADLIVNRQYALTHPNWSEEMSPEDYMDKNHHEVTYEYFHLNKRNENFRNPPVPITTQSDYQNLLYRMETVYGVYPRNIDILKDFAVLINNNFLPATKPHLSL